MLINFIHREGTRFTPVTDFHTRGSLNVRNLNYRHTRNNRLLNPIMEPKINIKYRKDFRESSLKVLSCIFTLLHREASKTCRTAALEDRLWTSLSSQTQNPYYQTQYRNWVIGRFKNSKETEQVQKSRHQREIENQAQKT